ncbi:MAG: hypothetical protein AAFP82_06185, partial [Bacteroidota bacterium]
MKRLFIVFLLFTCINVLVAQEENLGVLVQLHEQYTPDQFAKTFPILTFEKTVIKKLNIHLFKVDNVKNLTISQLEE